MRRSIISGSKMVGALERLISMANSIELRAAVDLIEDEQLPGLRA